MEVPHALPSPPTPITVPLELSFFWPNMHPDKLIFQFVLNLKMSITKVTEVSF